MPERNFAGLLALLLAGLTATACSAWEREYPSADPVALSRRLTDRAQWAYDRMALPPHVPVRPVQVIPGHNCYGHNCYAGGLSIDETVPGVVTWGHGPSAYRVRI